MRSGHKRHFLSRWKGKGSEVVVDALAAALIVLIASATGIDRPVDPALQADAERRVIEIQEDFSHTGLVFTEILAWNQGSSDPVAAAVRQWQASPTHWEIMSNPANTRIGCAVALVGNVSWFACSFDKVLLIAAVAPDIVLVPAPIVLPDTDLLPDAAMDLHFEREGGSIFEARLL